MKRNIIEVRLEGKEWSYKVWETGEECKRNKRETKRLWKQIKLEIMFIHMKISWDQEKYLRRERKKTNRIEQKCMYKLKKERRIKNKWTNKHPTRWYKGNNTHKQRKILLHSVVVSKLMSTSSAIGWVLDWMWGES